MRNPVTVETVAELRRLADLYRELGDELLRYPSLDRDGLDRAVAALAEEATHDD